jgi:hypothetical protein
VVLAACGGAREAGAPPAAPAQPKPAAAASSAMDSELARAAERGNMCSSREATAAGLQAQYFAQPDFTGAPLLQRLEGPVDDDWPKAGSQVAAPVRSARWRGWVRPPLTGAYAFHTTHDTARIVVSGKVLSPAPLGATGAEPATVQLAAGRYHPITVELRELPANGSPAVPLVLTWTAPHGARYVIPRTVLYPPSDTVEDARTAGMTAPR